MVARKRFVLIDDEDMEILHQTGAIGIDRIGRTIGFGDYIHRKAIEEKGGKK